jgi:hypothetical protein
MRFALRSFAGNPCLSAAVHETSAVASHAELRPGSRIHFAGDRGDLSERVRVSSGTRLAGVDPDMAPQYGENTFVPRGPWRGLSADEFELLAFGRPAQEAEWRPGADAAIIHIPDELFLPFANLLDGQAIREGANPEIVPELIKIHPDWSMKFAALREYLTALCDEEERERSFRTGLLRASEPNRLTLTTDDLPDSGKLAGMHLDSWDRLPLRHRARSRNRICINLGREPRYLLFVNLTLMDMFGRLRLRDPEDIYEDFRGLTIGRRFMASWPDYPVVRLRVDPGEAYILPTDNLLHDASTEGTTSADITLTYIGRFTPGGPNIENSTKRSI